MQIRWRPILVLLVLLGLGVLWLFWPEGRRVADLRDRGARYDVRILRDEWGVPHIFGAADEDVAYGLAYAHAEDDFLTIQQTLVAARGRLAYVYGRDAAPNDYMVHLLRIPEQIDAHYRELSPEARALHEAYADGLTHYAASHPDEVLPGLFPISGRDLAAAAVHKAPLFFGLDDVLGALFEEERPAPEALARARDGVPIGSNAFAVGPARTADGGTFLAVNSHQPWEGPVAWYEAHLHSEEGWDAVGGLFPGVPVIIHGHNRDLGWAFTVNHSDLIDVYELEIDPTDPNRYRFDGEWRTLEVRAAPISVRLLGRFRWTVNEEVLWSVYGPVVRRPHGTYAIRYAGRERVGLFEQLYRMNRARTLDEWFDAMAMQALPTFNVAYADREGNVLYLYNGLLPVRDERYDWSGYLPGDTSATLWTDYLPFDQLPRVLNPDTGFIQTTNSTPFRTTTGDDNPDPAAFSPTLGLDPRLSNRGRRALALFGGDPSITWDEFHAYKYDRAYDPDSDMAFYVAQLLAAPTPEDPDLRAGLDVLRAWDLRTDPDSQGAALAVLTVGPIGSLDGERVPFDVLWASYEAAVRTLKEFYGQLDPPWEEVNRLRRGDVDLGLGGGPDVLHAIYGELDEDGRLRGRAGDSYILLVRWDAEGAVHSESVHQYGSATLDPTSPHYADQAPLFVNRELKPVWMDEGEIRAHLDREYRPGE